MEEFLATNFNMEQFEYIIRIALACLCGGIIGLERSNRQKEAGFRTHIIIAMGAALIIIVSKYGFKDSIAAGMNADAARVAANVITGISFIGAGVIVVRGGTIKGLTTAAGIWTTAGIGLALGAGLYSIGIASTAILFTIQILLHRFLPHSESMLTTELIIKAKNKKDILDTIRKQLLLYNILIDEISIKQDNDDTVDIELIVKFPMKTVMSDIMQIANDNKDILEMTISS